MCSTLDKLNQSSAFQGHQSSKLIEIAFENKSPTFSKAQEISYFDSNLDAAQREGVALALKADHLAMIHGPPGNSESDTVLTDVMSLGTGKTTTVIEIIRQELERGNKVLACAASNIAVDNIVDRLARSKGFKHKVVRIGHPARLLPEVSRYLKPVAEK